MAKFDKKISNLVSRQLPAHIQANHPLLVEFVKQYYVFMDSAQITLSSVSASDQILLEAATGGFVALNATNEFGKDEGDYILSEQESIGEFTKGETITGATSGQTATILAEDTDALKLYVTENSLFVTGETLTGSTSGAQGVISRYRPNPNAHLTQLLEYADVNDTIDDFFKQFRNTFLQTLPNTLTNGLDKRQLTKNIISLYKAKGTKAANEIFFRALFNETPELYYPTVDMMRVSDGNFDTEQIIKATLSAPSDGNMNNLVGKTITQADIVGNDTVDIASSVVEKATISTISLNGVSHDVATFVLNKDSTSGSFSSSGGDGLVLDTAADENDNIILDGTDSSSTNAGDRLIQNTKSIFFGTDNTDSDVTIECNVESILDDVSVNSGGQYYSVGENINFTKEKGGTGAIAQIEQVTYGVIDSVQIENGGSGYAVGDALSVTNPTSGDGLAGTVAVVNGGFTLEGDTHDDGILLLEQGTGFQLVMEAATNSSSNDITKIRLSNKGGGYLSLPTVSVTSTGGSNALVYPVSSSIGKALSAKVIDHGFRYETAPEVSPKLHIQIDTLSSNFTSGETITASSEDYMALEAYEQIDFPILLEDFRQAVIRLEDFERGDLVTEDGEQFALEEFVSGAVPESASPDFLRDETDNDRIVYNEYVLKDNTDYIVLNGTDGSSTNEGGKIQRDDQETASGTFETFDAATNILTLKETTGTFDDKVTITGSTSGETARVRNYNPQDTKASMTATVGTAIETDGSNTGVDGQLSESTKKVQDSLYYQDYSYIIKVGESITEWRDYLKSAIHPAGFYFQGEVAIKTQLNAKMKTGYTRISGLTETDEVVEILSVIFSEKIGRRLGTPTDGTSVRSTPQLGIEGSASFGTTRDVTLNQEITLKTNQQTQQQFRSTDIKQGLVYAGPRMKTIGNLVSGAFDHTPDRMLLNGTDGSSTHGNDGLILEDGGDMKQELGLRDMDSGITIATINSIKLTGTGNTSFDGEANRIDDFSTGLKTNFTIPAQIKTSLG
ncbi:head closure Hc2 [Pelagibacter phage HTVC008M]|uniref:head closure Hc2 n=1 Tax=Pelagibacter phage HTVC008M TaxID=1283076 RepID=UPI0002B2A24F|nr:head closure Hc2 [Pelagibacter phage HTVC008M]AGE60389.1 putative structural protein [Pelagibacter phage HTVC008M]